MWLEVLAYTDPTTIRSVTRTCSTLRWVAQPLLFKHFGIFLPSLPTQEVRRDTHFAANTYAVACLSVLRFPHLAHAIEELKIQTTEWPSSPLSFDKHPPDHTCLSQATEDLVTLVFRAVPSLVNLKRLVCHGVTFTTERLLALTQLPQLIDLELHSCSTTCSPSLFPTFAAIPLETLTFDFPYSSLVPYHNPHFLLFLLQPPTLKRVSIGPASDIIDILARTPSPSKLTALKIPISSLSSPLLLPVLASCPFVTDLALSAIPSDHCHPQLEADVLPQDILPLLSSYRGPSIYAPFFAHGRALGRMEFTLSCQPEDVESTILTISLNPVSTGHIHSFACNVQYLNTTLFQTIHAAFPSLTHLAISGAAVDIYTLSAVFLCAENAELMQGKRNMLRNIQLCVQMGLPRPTLRWTTIAAGSFLELLIEAYPELQMARFVYQPEQAVVWRRPLQTRMDMSLITNVEQFWIEKQEGGDEGFWKIVKKKW
jgi:hypothetical protein